MIEKMAADSFFSLIPELWGFCLIGDFFPLKGFCFSPPKKAFLAAARHFPKTS